jgi:site-specific DNA-cytosine methylase
MRRHYTSASAAAASRARIARSSSSSSCSAGQARRTGRDRPRPTGTGMDAAAPAAPAPAPAASSALPKEVQDRIERNHAKALERRRRSVLRKEQQQQRLQLEPVLLTVPSHTSPVAGIQGDAAIDEGEADDWWEKVQCSQLEHEAQEQATTMQQHAMVLSPPASDVSGTQEDKAANDDPWADVQWSQLERQALEKQQPSAPTATSAASTATTTTRVAPPQQQQQLQEHQQHRPPGSKLKLRIRKLTSKKRASGGESVQQVAAVGAAAAVASTDAPTAACHSHKRPKVAKSLEWGPAPWTPDAIQASRTGKLPVLSLCCGAGGFDIGLEQAQIADVGTSFSLKWAVDCWIDACQTVRLNFPGATVFNQDLEEFLNGCVGHQEGYPRPRQAFLICAGLPCQGFSLANVSKANLDERNMLFRTFVKIVDFLKPAYVLVEEVPNFLVDKQIDAQAARLELEGCGIRCSTDLKKHNGEVCAECLRAVLMSRGGPASDRATGEDEGLSQSAQASQPTLTQPIPISSGDFYEKHTRSLPGCTLVKCVGQRLKGTVGPHDMRFCHLWGQMWKDFTDAELPTVIPGSETVTQLEELGFSVTVGVADFSCYGLPQSRKRACLIAAAPGWGRVRLPPVTHQPADHIRGVDLGLFKPCQLLATVPDRSRPTIPGMALDSCTLMQWVCCRQLTNGMCSAENHYQVKECWKCHGVKDQLFPTRTIGDALGQPAEFDAGWTSDVLSEHADEVSTWRRLGGKVGGTVNLDALPATHHVALQVEGEGSKVAIVHARPGEKLSDCLSRVRGELDPVDRQQFDNLVRRERAQDARRANMDEAAKTLICKISRDASPQYWHPTQGRLLSVREAMRLQSFPDKYRLQTHRTKDIHMIESWYKQIGNAVPPLVAKLWGEQILRAAISGGTNPYGVDTPCPWQTARRGARAEVE